MSAEPEQYLAALAVRFADRAGAYRADLAQSAAARNRAEIASLAHKLAGSAAMFGHPRIGEAALKLEIAVEAGAEAGGELAALDRLLAELEV